MENDMPGIDPDTDQVDTANSEAIGETAELGPLGPTNCIERIDTR
jgi:hypothetical protein